MTASQTARQQDPFDKLLRVEFKGPAIEVGERRVLRGGRWLPVRALLWFVLLFFLTAAAYGLPLQMAVDRLPPGSTQFEFAGVLLACTACLACYAVAVQVGEGRIASELALRPLVRELAVGLLLGPAMMATLMSVLAVAGLYDMKLLGPAPAWSGLGLALQAAVTEELWMRALLLRLLWRAFGPAPAFAVAGLVFGGLHLANPGATPVAGLTATLAGLMFCALYALSGRLWLPIGVHLAWNFAQGYLFGAAVSGGDLGDSIAVTTARDEAPAWLTGGSFGPEASVFALGTIGLVTIGVLLLSRRTGRFHGSPGAHRV